EVTPTTSATEGSDASLIVTLGEAAPEGGLALSVTYETSGTASADDIGTSKPEEVIVPGGENTAELLIPLKNDDLVEGDESFTVTLSTDLSGWFAASTGASATVTITDDDDDNAKIAFSTNAASTAKYTASVAENVSGGTVKVPVTANNLPGTTTTFMVAVVLGGTATESTDYSIGTKEVTFGPTSTKTQNVSITITDDEVIEVDETVELRIVAADETVDDLGDLYVRHASGALATLTITNDEVPVDTTPPTLTITGVPAKINDTTPLNVTFTFSESVTEFVTEDVTVTGGTKGTFAGSGTTYTLAVTPTGSANVVVTVAADAATDGVNTGPASVVTETATWDAAAPTLTITGVPAKINDTTPLNVTFTFSESVTEFVIGDVTITGGSKGTFAGSGTTYTLVVTPTGSEDVVVTVATGVATDGINTSPASAVTETATWDAAGPAAPTNLSVVTGIRQLTLTWTAPLGLITSYNVHYTSASVESVSDDSEIGTDEANSWVAADRIGASTSQVIANLNSGTTYRVRVRSVNNSGNSSWVTGTGIPEADTTLSDLSVTSSTSVDNPFSELTLDPSTFAPETTDYTATVENEVTHVKITPTVN
ncbi:MAG: Ig-like domain-containing protein, partial [Acidimicrobiaceae bacterium]|nr:Ig-like domain-containing protein [Acidimicrobiaceae bacterium]